jgi:hypothetical protein
LIGWWPVAPGLTLIAVGWLIQFGTYVRRPRSFQLIRTGIRLRFIGSGVFFLGIGVNAMISALFDGLQVGGLVLGLVVIGFAALWFYAASDRIFRQ